MPISLKRNTLLAAMLAGLFWWAFMFAKHNATLRPLIPFGDDPYDSVGSFAVLAAAVLAGIALVRALRPYRAGPTAWQRLHLVRSQQAIVLAVVITVASDVVAMLRHPRMWAPARGQLIALLSGIATAALLVHVAISRSRESLPEQRRAWGAGTIALVAALALLAVYPERWIDRLFPHLFTIVAGAAMLFVPMGLLLPALVPGQPDRMTTAHSRRRWALALLAGIAVGAFAFVGEMAEGTGGAAASRLALVGMVFTGLGAAGILIAFACLARPLGLD